MIILAAIKYLDLSHQQTFSDEELLKKIGTFGVPDVHVSVFSAAHNNLSHVPYNALTVMSLDLKFLTLSGNNFNVMVPDYGGNGKFVKHNLGVIETAAFLMGLINQHTIGCLISVQYPESSICFKSCHRFHYFSVIPL